MGGEKSKVSSIKLKPSGKVSVVPPYVYLPCSYRKCGRCFITLLDLTGDSTITPLTSVICIPLPIGVLGKRGTFGI